MVEIVTKEEEHVLQREKRGTNYCSINHTLGVKKVRAN